MAQVRCDAVIDAIFRGAIDGASGDALKPGVDGIPRFCLLLGGSFVFLGLHASTSRPESVVRRCSSIVCNSMKSDVMALGSGDQRSPS